MPFSIISKRKSFLFSHKTHLPVRNGRSSLRVLSTPKAKAIVESFLILFRQSCRQIRNNVRTSNVTAEDQGCFSQRIGAGLSSHHLFPPSTHLQGPFRGSTSKDHSTPYPPPSTTSFKENRTMYHFVVLGSLYGIC